MTFWIELELYFAFFFRQVIHILFWGELDLIFAVQVITIVFWTVLDSIFTFFCMQVIHMLFWGGVRLNLYPLLPASDHRDVLD